VFRLSLSGITRTGSMGLISARIFKAPLFVDTNLRKRNEKKENHPGNFPFSTESG